MLKSQKRPNLSATKKSKHCVFPWEIQWCWPEIRRGCHSISNFVLLLGSKIIFVFWTLYSNSTVVHTWGMEVPSCAWTGYSVYVLYVLYFFSCHTLFCFHLQPFLFLCGYFCVGFKDGSHRLSFFWDTVRQPDSGTWAVWRLCRMTGASFFFFEHFDDPQGAKDTSSFSRWTLSNKPALGLCQPPTPLLLYSRH